MNYRLAFGTFLVLGASGGVPPERMPAKGVNDIVYIWDSHKKHIKNWTCLSKWKYDCAIGSFLNLDLCPR